MVDELPWWERHQAGCAVLTVAVAALVALLLPGSAALAPAIEPVLGLLLFTTFLAVPLRRLVEALRDLRFLSVLLLLNFVVVPAVVFGLTRFVAADQALLIGVLLVLLAPCIDYVIVFTGLAGGAHERLLATAPVLLLAQLLLLPVFLTLFVGPAVLDVIEPGPFVRALLLLIVLPLLAAAGIQALAAHSAIGRAVKSISAAVMTPLLLLTLFVVVASQVPGLTGLWSAVLPALPVFAAFLLIMAIAGAIAGRVAGFDPPTTRALTFSGATRNSLVVLPLALALPASLGTVPAVVVGQTLVELIGMVLFVRWIPRLVPLQPPPPA